MTEPFRTIRKWPRANTAGTVTSVSGSDLQSLFLREALYKCVRHDGPRDLPPLAGVFSQAFVDTASGSDESYAIAISQRDPHGRAIVVCTREWVSPFDPFDVTAEAAALLKSYGCFAVTGDRYSPGWVAGAFKQHGIDYLISERTKSQIFMETAALVNSGSVEFPDDPRLLGQFLGLQRRVGSSGRDAVDHRNGQRDDLANAVAGSVVMAVSTVGKASLDTVFRGCAKNSALPESSRVHCVLHGGSYTPSDPICRKECRGWQVVAPQFRAYQKAGGEQNLRTFVRLRFTSATMEGNQWEEVRSALEAQLGL